MPEPRCFALENNLFIDDDWIAASDGLTRATQQPEKLPSPILDQDRPVYYMTVSYDPELGRYRMWYNAMGHPDHGPKLGYAYAESSDGVSWERPDLGLVGANYLDAPMGHWSFPFVDDGPDCRDPARRYKMGYYDAAPGRGMGVAFSADGLRFRPYAGNPVVPHMDPEMPPDAPDSNIISDILDACYDPVRGEYLLGCKVWRGGFTGKPHHAPEGHRRCVGLSASRDFVTWERPRVIVTPDPEHGLEEFYGMKPIVRGNHYIGFLRVLRDDLPATPGGPVEGIGWTELMTSADGRHWIRHPEPFLDREPRDGHWDHAMAWFGDIVTVGDREYVYYGGYRAGHKIRAQIGDRSLGLALLRKNGFVARRAKVRSAWLKTPAARLPARTLTVNAVVRGELRVRLVNEQGVAQPGCDWSDGPTVRGDAVAHRIDWRGADGMAMERALSLEFMLSDADLYGFDFLPAGQ